MSKVTVVIPCYNAATFVTEAIESVRAQTVAIWVWSGCGPPSAAMVRKTMFLEVGGYRDGGRYSEDYDLWLRLAERFEIVASERVTCRYRLHPSQDTRNALGRRPALPARSAGEGKLSRWIEQR